MLLDTLNFQSDLETTFDDVIDRMSEARGRIESHDDATLIEIACTFPELVENAPELADENGGWDYAVRFDSAALKRADLILMVTPVMESMVPKQELRKVALTVLGGVVHQRARSRGVGAFVDAQARGRWLRAVPLHTRGIDLVEELCTSVAYNERGNEVEAVLNW